MFLELTSEKSCKVSFLAGEDPGIQKQPLTVSILSFAF